MLNRESGEKDCDGHGRGHVSYPRVPVKSSQERPHGDEPDRQAKAQARINPEQVADQSMIDLFPLEDGLREAVEAHVLQKQAEGGNHGHQPEILGGEKPSQDDGGGHLSS